jgi:hypothetical protein
MFDSDHRVNAYDRDVPANAHKLACVFLVLAIGVMFDLNRQPCTSRSRDSRLQAVDPRGEQLFLLGRACLSAVGMEHASPATVQALHLCGTYMMNDQRRFISDIELIGRWERGRDVLADPWNSGQGCSECRCEQKRS